jgi:tetratricopeptide (TPR) repeat protein
MNLDAFLKDAWKEHGEQPQDVAELLSASTHLVEAAEQVAPYAQLVTHVYGEHLGLWESGVELLESLRQLPVTHVAAGTRGVAVGIATLRYAGGNPAALDTLSTDDAVSALATASSALLARGEATRAIESYAMALRAARAAPAVGAPAIRALAVGGNNLAAALEEKSQRSDYETQGMLTAAEAGLQYWKQAGTWLEEERAEYRLARSRLQAGEAAAAVQSAERCVRVCKRNAAPAFELFFAHAVLALAQRAAGDGEAFQAQRSEAMACLGQVPEHDRQWCEGDRKELEG